MNCSCPKCSTPVEFDPAGIGDSGISAVCNSCRTKLVISSEDFSRRLFRRASKISCSKCGAALGVETYCANCGEPFPDYFVAEEPSERKKRLNASKRNDIKLTGFSFEFRFRKKAESSRSISAEGLTQLSEPVGGKRAETVKAEPVSAGKAKLIKILISLTVIAAVAFGSYYYINLKKKEKEFVSQSMKALYRVKAGKDMGSAACLKMLSSGNLQIKITPDEEQKIKKASPEIIASVSSLTPPSSKYESTVNSIKKLGQISERYRTLALSPPPTSSELSDSLKKLDSEFASAVSAFKREMPEKISTGLVEAKRVYKPLGDF